MFFGPSGLPRSLSMSFWAWSIQLLDVGSSPCGMMRSQPKQWALIPLDTKSWHLWLGRSLLEWRGAFFATFTSFLTPRGSTSSNAWLWLRWVLLLEWEGLMESYILRFFCAFYREPHGALLPLH